MQYYWHLLIITIGDRHFMIEIPAKLKFPVAYSALCRAGHELLKRAMACNGWLKMALSQNRIPLNPPVKIMFRQNCYVVRVIHGWSLFSDTNDGFLKYGYPQIIHLNGILGTHPFMETPQSRKVTQETVQQQLASSPGQRTAAETAESLRYKGDLYQLGSTGTCAKQPFGCGLRQ